MLSLFKTAILLGNRLSDNAWGCCRVTTYNSWTIFATTPKGNPEARSRTQNILDLDSLWIRIRSVPLLNPWSNEYLHTATTSHESSFSWLMFLKTIPKMEIAVAAVRTITNGLTIIRADRCSDLCRHHFLLLKMLILTMSIHVCVWTINLVRPRFRIDVLVYLEFYATPSSPLFLLSIDSECISNWINLAYFFL